MKPVPGCEGSGHLSSFQRGSEREGRAAGTEGGLGPYRGESGGAEPQRILWPLLCGLPPTPLIWGGRATPKALGDFPLPILP